MSVVRMAIVLVVVILALAICLGKEVKFSIRLPGADASLEVSDRHLEYKTSLVKSVQRRTEERP